MSLKHNENKTIAFLSHNKSFNRIIPDIKALRELGICIIVLSNSKELRPDFIYENEFFEVDIGNEISIANILSPFNITALVTPTDHLLVTVVNVCKILRIDPPCDLPTAELFVNKFKHIQHIRQFGLGDSVPKCAIIKNYDDLLSLSSEIPKELFIKPDIGCGMRGVFPSKLKDDFLFEYKGLKNTDELLSILKENNFVEDFISYCTVGVNTKHYYPTKPKALIQEFYHTNKSYTFQYTILNGEWHYNTIGQLFSWVQKSESRSGERLNPLQDPRERMSDGTRMHTEELGYYHLPEVPEHIFPFFQKCVNYMKDNFKINNMSLTLAIHETLDGRFLMTDLNPRVGGQWIMNHQFSQPNFYLKYWDSFLNKSSVTFEHSGPLGCVNSILMDPGTIDTCILPDDTKQRIITSRNKLSHGEVVPEIQSINAKDWDVKVYTCGQNLNDQISNVIDTIKLIRNNTTYF
jgi:hypothetical protein